MGPLPVSACSAVSVNVVSVSSRVTVSACNDISFTVLCVTTTRDYRKPLISYGVSDIIIVNMAALHQT